MLITITYRSSLVAHLTVPGKSPTLDSLEDLLAAHRKASWTWGFEPTYGSGWEWLKSNQNPTVKEIFNSIMVCVIRTYMALGALCTNTAYDIIHRGRQNNLQHHGLYGY